ncbi:MAG TPA: hypothetical protein VK003_14805 [Oceanobacillus sp.]|nr:hypothetical protein [Oceanobacillus sp.]
MALRTISIDERAYELLQKWAKKRQLSLEEIVHESITEYDRRLSEDEQFDAEIDEIMREQAWLLNELKNR